MQSRPQRPQVLIVGAGFGGLEATKALARAEVDVTLVDANNHHCFSRSSIRSQRRRSRRRMWPSRSAPSCATSRTSACLWRG